MAKVTPVTSKGGNASGGTGYPGAPAPGRRPSGYPGRPVANPVHGSQAALNAALIARRASARAASIASFKAFTARKAGKGKHPKAGKASRGLSPGDISCCVMQALAASVRGEGFPVTDDDVVALHLRIAGPDEYVTIGDGLEAAAQYGLAGVRPVIKSCASARLNDAVCEACGCELDGEGWCPWCQPPGSLILGVTTPAPHAVCDDGAGWLSWGQRYEPWAEPDEMWAVSWG